MGNNGLDTPTPEQTTMNGEGSKHYTTINGDGCKQHKNNSNGQPTNEIR
jgi:hypothetical protein